MDIDSTVQEANIAYPADATLMKKLCEKAHHVLAFLKKRKKAVGSKEPHLDIARIRQTAQRYFFLAKNATIEERRALFKRYHQLVKSELRPVIAFCQSLSERTHRTLPWHIRRTLTQVREQGWRYLLDVGYFVRTHTLKPGKILSFQAQAVTGIKKGKAGKPHEFGRVFQLGRIGGNFLVAFSCTSVRMEDKHSLLPAIHEHRRLFGEEALKQIGADKGYYSAKNITDMQALSLNAEGVQRPTSVKDPPRPRSPNRSSAGVRASSP